MLQSISIELFVTACVPTVAMALVQLHIERPVAALLALHANSFAPVIEVVPQDVGIELVRLFLAVARITLHRLLLLVARPTHGSCNCEGSC